MRKSTVWQALQNSGGNMQRLTSDYRMDEEHGLIDDEIIAYSTQDKILEIHLDYKGKINQVYLVM